MKKSKSKRNTPKHKKTSASFLTLVKVMQKLRSPQGCPWDREQTHASIVPQLIEETYEVIETIHEENYDQLRGELGDLLLHVLFHAQIAAEERRFDIDDVVSTLHDKLVHRHPHVFGDASSGKKPTVKSASDVNRVWAQAKLKEGKKSLLGGVPRAMPAMQRAWRLNEKASSVGFDWQTTQEVLEKVQEERLELEEAIASGNQAAIEEEYGDLLFALINLSRFLKLDPERALHGTSEKFTHRFNSMEKEAEANGKHLANLSFQELEDLYQQSRRNPT